MALALGTNSGFVTVAPTADPAETGSTIDGNAVVTKHTSPANADRITSIGWYRASGTNSANWEIALYSDLAGVPVTRLFVDATNSSTANGWLTVAVDWDIAPSTPYWLALQMDAHSGSSSVDGAASGGAGSDLFAASTLADPYAGGTVADADGMYAIYALISVLDTTDDLLADDIAAGTPTLTSAALKQTHALAADDLATGTPTLTVSVLGQKHVLGVNGVTSGTPTLTSPALSEGAQPDDLLADDILVGTPILTSGVMGQAHVLSADDLVGGTPTLTSAVLGQTHTLTASNIASAESFLETPALMASGGEVEIVAPTQGFARGRGFGPRPPYYWEAARSERLRELTPPTDPKARKVEVEVISDLESLWASLESRDRNFNRMLQEVDRLIERTATHLESLRLAQLLAETKQRIEAAKDAERESLKARASLEDAEIKELLRFL